MNSSSSPHCTNRCVWHRLISAVRGDVKYIAAKLTAFNFPWALQQIQTGATSKSAELQENHKLHSTQFRNLSHLFPSNEIHLCLSSPSDDVNGYNSPRAYSRGGGGAYETAWQVSGQSAGQTMQKSAVGLKGDVGGHAGSERRKSRGTLFIMADCLSVWFPASIHYSFPHPHTPLIGFPSLPIRV